MADDAPNPLISKAESAIAAYRQQVEFVAANDLGRPSRVKKSLDFMASGAGDIFRVGKIPVALKFPEFDKVHSDPTDADGNDRPDPGMYKPSHNAKFLKAHQENLTALEQALAKLREPPKKKPEEKSPADAPPAP